MSKSKNFGFQTFEYTKHVLEKADERNIDLNIVEHTIEYGDKIAEYPSDKPYPSFLYLSFFEGRPLHVCFAQVNNITCRVITAYEPSLLIFENDYKTKRKQ
ncbi:MAG: DUF4258 domain-containing protein [Chitinophagales bacterium]|nr:DUF4258 domain-containing protein [Chitinophagales bacterium]